MPKKRSFRRYRLGVMGASLLIFIFIALYFAGIYRQLDQAFGEESFSQPLRIYSDVTRIQSTQLRSEVESRLNALGYTYQTHDAQIVFKLHPIEYPRYLVPEVQVQWASQGLPITLTFDGEKTSASLQTIEVNAQEVSEVSLEPEWVATLTTAGNIKREIRTPLRFEEFPSPIWKAIIAIEDHHFLEHQGLDWRGLARAMWVNLKTFSLAQGGSTITQQLVKNLTERRNKNIFRKVNELFLALILEARFDKEQILERYLNEVYLGQVGQFEVHGVAEAAELIFGKRVTDLNLAESALIAGLIRGPGYYSPYRHRDRALQRQRLVLKKMVETGQIAPEEEREALLQEIHIMPAQPVTTKAPFFTDYIKANLLRIFEDKMTETELFGSGYKVYTTLDLRMNSLGQSAVSKGVSQLEKDLKTVQLEGALAAVENETGRIRALVGGRDYSKSNFNRILNMRRQVGSAFKPVVYLAALLKGRDSRNVPFGPAYPIEDAPWTWIFDQGRQKWTPRNDQRTHLGWLSLRQGLSLSINTVTAKIAQTIGLPQVLETAKKLGISSQLPEVPSVSLGVAELTPIELLEAYFTLANHGLHTPLHVIRSVVQRSQPGEPEKEIYRTEILSKKAIQPAACDLMIDLLQSVFSEGTAKSARLLGFDRPAAGKTGTTSNYRDSWFAGITPQLTTVVWVGMDQVNAETQKTPARLTGARAALPIWVNFTEAALSGEAPTPFPSSSDLVDVQIDRHTGQEASSDCPSSQTVVEKYLRESLPEQKTCSPVWMK